MPNFSIAYDFAPTKKEQPSKEPSYSRYEIREVNEGYNPTLHIEVKGLYSLPEALKRLADLGYDLSASLEALQQAVTAQQKRKALDEAVAGLNKE